MDQRPNDPDTYAPLSWSGVAQFALGDDGLRSAYLSGAPVYYHVSKPAGVPRDVCASGCERLRLELNELIGGGYTVRWSPAGKFTMQDAKAALDAEKRCEERLRMARSYLLKGMATPFGAPRAFYTVTRE